MKRLMWATTFVTWTILFAGCENAPTSTAATPVRYGFQQPVPKTTAPTPEREFANAFAKREKLRNSFESCQARAFTALDIGRQYHLSHRNKDKVLASATNLDKDFALDVMREMDASPSAHYVNIAAERLEACGRQEGITVDETHVRYPFCFARTDLAFFLWSFRDSGQSRATAIAQTERLFSDPTVYPKTLVETVARLTYATKSVDDVQELRNTLFWTCVTEPLHAKSAASPQAPDVAR